MSETPKYLLIDSTIAPDIFVRVVRAKQLIAQGKAQNSSQAARMAGISRSAYYKYKDFVHRFDEHLQNSVTTLYVTLEDEPGVLSNLLTQLYKAGANIITVNQNIPVDGVAPVSLAVRLDSGRVSVDELIAMMQSLDGVVRATNI
ncbi:MAG: ACT domain-containing protein [Clostridiales bacterium]|uniref:Chorismate mutase n=1 Tax=Harryflintia acetispora TaxID=1849041 RepID=A0A9X8UHR8_9FIRM|nr:MULTISPECIES: ACT domain-containing protein [Oscillospiraceae]PWM34265.1 MAG: ACT domain-containing protein [Clostridiales bacterium]RGB63716.1 ACT domain-containing protein [Harryflintia acetispora]TCL40706.1 chorismate mutase [Harryflintia acetispora]